MDNINASFKSLLIKTDVTALKILNKDYLLVGIGNTLSLYNVPNKNFITSREIFLGQKIHGIIPSANKDKVAVFGGKQINTCSLSINDDESNIILDKNHICCDDWILTLIWTKNEECFSVLTAHNVVQTWDIETNTLRSHFRCEEKCILYSGLLKEINNRVIVFAGTVFSQIVIWTTDSERIEKRLTGHKGVIFSISYCDINNIIATSSDDRSVKIWSVNSADKNVDDQNYWFEVEIECTKTLFGHTARVMRNQIAGSHIVSIGEDSTMCRWNIDGSLLCKQRIHRDGCLWSLDCDLNSNMIVTGGNDSGVMIHPLFYSNPQSDNFLKFPFDSLKPKLVSLTARNNIVCLGEQGELIYYIVDDDEWNIQKSDEFKPNTMSLSKCKQFIALTDLSGNLIVFVEPCKFDPKLVQCINQKVCDGRMLSFIWLSNRNVCVCDSNGVIAIWGSHGSECFKLNEFLLPLCKERWLTVAEVMNDTTIVGDRCGNIHLYDKKSRDPIQTVNKVHGRLGTNYIRIDGNKMITCGRDGTVKYFTISSSRIRLLHFVKLPFNWVDRFINKEKMIVCGFRETDLVIWDINDNRILFETNCGGGHRSWDICKTRRRIKREEENVYELIYIKNSLIYKLDMPIKNISQYIINGYHIKEINTLISFKDKMSRSFNIISAGEDTTIIFNQCKIDAEYEYVTLDNQFKIDKHLSSVRCLCLYDENEKSVLFSAGGRAQLCAWELNPISNEIREIGNHLLKGSDYERKGNSKPDADAETRIMSLTCLNSSNFTYIDSDDGIVLFAGCSDGFLRVYIVKDEIHLWGTFNFNSKCILKVHSIVFNSHPVVFSMSVDGIVSIWDFYSAEEKRPVLSFKSHKAGINSFDMSRITDGKFIIATGGDDNDIRLDVISMSIDERSNVLKVEKNHNWNCDKYHCSQIGGVKLVHNQYLLSASIDQRITVLRLFYSENDGLKCEFYGQYHLSVSDIQGMDVLDHNKNHVFLCVYGVGIEIVKIDLK